MPEGDEPEIPIIKAAAEVLSTSEQTLPRWDKAGKLRAKRHYRLYARC